jgi:predicted nuclease of predicted toxin-antitoxin system
MKLLLDQNLSFRLIPKLDSLFPASKHVKDFGLTEDDDQRIWDLAADQGFTIVTKDADFQSRSLLHGSPPKVIQLRLGNCSTRRILDVLTDQQDDIRRFFDDPDVSLLVIE